MQVAITISIPDVAGAPSTWVPSSLVTVTSAGILRGVAGDSVLLCGSNDNAVAVTSDLLLSSFFGDANQEDMGTAAAQLGAFKYFAVIRKVVVTAGLVFELVGDDGEGGGGGGTVTANQGAPNAGGNQAWPVVDDDTTLLDSRIITGSNSSVQATAVTGKAYLGVYNLDASQEVNLSEGGAASPTNGALPGKVGAIARYTDVSQVNLYIPTGVRVSVFVWR